MQDWITKLVRAAQYEYEAARNRHINVESTTPARTRVGVLLRESTTFKVIRIDGDRVKVAIDCVNASGDKYHYEVSVHLMCSVTIQLTSDVIIT